MNSENPYTEHSYGNAVRNASLPNYNVNDNISINSTHQDKYVSTAIFKELSKINTISNAKIIQTKEEGIGFFIAVEIGWHKRIIGLHKSASPRTFKSVDAAINFAKKLKIFELTIELNNEEQE